MGSPGTRAGRFAVRALSLRKGVHDPCYSILSALIGSMRVALRAGT